MQRRVISTHYFSIPDAVILLLAATAIYGVFAIGREWRSEFSPVTSIDLSVWALPYYTLLSGIRGMTAYGLSLVFALGVGYLAAKSKTSEQILIPILDILQSIPILGFLPGLVLGFVTLFPKTNTGLELAAILMIFTSQVWNMTFSYYDSLKLIPKDFQEAATMMGLSKWQRWLRLEMPFSAVNLAWNSLLAMAGGWFFLIPCEAITLGSQQYLLPGIGSYTYMAIQKNQYDAIFFAVVAMVLLIVLMDFVIWRPILAWVRRFRLESLSENTPEQPLMQIWIRESKILRGLKLLYRDLFSPVYQHHKKEKFPSLKIVRLAIFGLGHRFRWLKIYQNQLSWASFRFLKVFLLIWVLVLCTYGSSLLIKVVLRLPLSTWILLFRDALWTFLRVVMTLVLSTLWAVPVGIWIGTSPRRIGIAQPLIQIIASFPTPMLYPLVLTGLFTMGVGFDWAAMLLMFLGVQWYVLFNVLAGASRISKELNDVLFLTKTSRWDRWRKLYLPSVFPSLVTGWITASGSAWNTSVVAEYIFYQGKILRTGGLGAVLNVATANGDFALFAGTLTLMVGMVIFLNRFVWSRVYHLAQTRYQMEV